MDFAVDARLPRRGLLDNGYGELPVVSEHAVAIAGLPPIHRDPFDRLLVAQATVEGITLLTADEYGGSVSRTDPPSKADFPPLPSPRGVAKSRGDFRHRSTRSPSRT